MDSIGLMVHFQKIIGLLRYVFSSMVVRIVATHHGTQYLTVKV